MMMLVLQLAAETDVEAVHRRIDSFDSLLELAGTENRIVTLFDRDKVIRNTVKWYCFGRNRAAFERFQEGLKSLGVLEAVRAIPQLFEQVFCYEDVQLTAAMVTALFRPHYSLEGTNERTAECRVISWWRDYLLDAEWGQFHCEG